MNWRPGLIPVPVDLVRAALHPAYEEEAPRLDVWEWRVHFPIRFERLYIPLEDARHCDVVQIRLGRHDVLQAKTPGRAYARIGGTPLPYEEEVLIPGMIVEIKVLRAAAHLPTSIPVLFGRVLILRQ